MNWRKATQSKTATEPDAVAGERVVLLDESGNAIGTADKVAVHTGQTPLHLAFSCYIFNSSGEILMTRRALDKRVFPGVWTNSVCGHPEANEDLAEAARRRAADELGLLLRDPRLILPGFRYQAEKFGILENEACPVLTAGCYGDPAPNPDEVADWKWLAWSDFVSLVLHGNQSAPELTQALHYEISPWCRLQVSALVQLGPYPDMWPDGDPALLPAALPTW